MKTLTIYIACMLLSCKLLAQVDGQIAALEDSIQVKVKQYGKKHESTLKANKNLIKFLYGNGKYDEVIKAIHKYLDICLESFGYMHNETADMYNLLGLNYKEIGKFSNAEKYLKKALAIYDSDEKQLSSATVYHNLGSIHYAKGDYVESIKEYQKSLKIREELLDENSLEVAGTYNNLGSTFRKIDNYAKSIEYYEKALKIYQDKLSAKHDTTAIVYNNIGEVYFATGEYQKAVEYFKSALSINLKVLGEKHPSTATTYNNLASFYTAIGDYNIAYRYFIRARDSYLKASGKTHPLLGDLYINIGSYLIREARFQQP